MDDPTQPTPAEAPSNAEASNAPVPAAHWPTPAPGVFPSTLDPTLGRPQLDVGDVIQTCGRLFAANVVRDPGFVLVFSLVVLLVTGLPIGAAIGIAVARDVDFDRMSESDGAAFGFVILALVVYAIAATTLGFAVVSGGIMHGALESIEGRRATFGEMASRALSRALPLVGVAIVHGVVVTTGLVFCLVPGILAALAFAASIPFVIHARLGVVDAIGRSFTLTRGHRFEIFVVYLATFAVVFLVNMATSCLSWVAMLPLGAISARVGESGAGWVAAGMFSIWMVVYLVGTAFQQLAFAYAPAVVYARLAGLGRTVDAPEIARVFS